MPLALREIASFVFSRWPWPHGVRTRRVKSALRLAARSVDALYFHTISQWPHPNALVIGAQEPSTTFPDGDKWPGITDPLLRTLLLDLIHLLR